MDWNRAQHGLTIVWIRLQMETESNASLAQLVEHALRKRMVVGSIPTGGLSCVFIQAGSITVGRKLSQHEWGGTSLCGLVGAGDSIVSYQHMFEALMFFKTVWPSGLRRWLQAPVRKGVGSNPTAVIL